MKKIEIKTSTHPYCIYIGTDLLKRVEKYLEKQYSSIFIITDNHVASLYLQEVKDGLNNNTVHTSVIQSGEASKSIETYYELQTKAIEIGLDRQSLIIALGGGVVGDLAGFVAATYMRGIDYVQIPTTILAHDSSVGGKVAINHKLGKNMIGNFYPPKAVIYDVNTLTTLPIHEVRSGYAEIMKEALIADENLFKNLLEIEVKNVSSSQLQYHLYEAIKVKAEIVEQDERESSVRKFLNLVHTFAHALEATLGYGKLTHGEAVAIGLLFAIKVSEEQLHVQLPYVPLKHWLRANDYPLTWDANIQAMIRLMKSDKKSEKSRIQMVLMKSIGELMTKELSDDFLINALMEFKKELGEDDTGI